MIAGNISNTEIKSWLNRVNAAAITPHALQVSLWASTSSFLSNEVFLMSAAAGVAVVGIEIIDLASNTADADAIAAAQSGPSVTCGPTGSLASLLEAMVFAIGSTPQSSPPETENAPYSLLTTGFWGVGTTVSVAMGFANPTSTAAQTATGGTSSSGTYGAILQTFK